MIGAIPVRLVLLAILFPSIVGAQQERFVGSWTLDPGRSGSSHAPAAERIDTASQKIAYATGELAIEATRNGKEYRVRYSLDAAADPEPVGTSGADTGVGLIVKWDHNELTTATPMQINGKTITIYERRTLTPDLREMIVETSIRVEHGYEGQGINQSKPVQDIYVKVP